MSWKFNGSEPIDLQIAEEVMLRMIDGTYHTGSRLPSVRELALEAGGESQYDAEGSRIS